MNVFLCQSAVRLGGNGRDSYNRINSPEKNISGNPSQQGYGYVDYAPSVYADINAANDQAITGGVTSMRRKSL